MPNKEWFIKHKKILLWLLNTSIIKIWFRWVLRINGQRSIIGDKKVIKMEPNAIWWIKKITSKKIYCTTEFRTHDKFAKRLFYTFKPLWYLLHIWDILIANPFVPAWNLGFDVLTVYPDPNPETATVDGDVRRESVDQTYTAIRDGVGTLSVDTDTGEVQVGVLSSATTDQFKDFRRSIYLFDTSSIPDANNIDSAILSIFGTGKNSGLGQTPFHIVSSTPASNTALVAGDYTQTGTTTFGNITHANFSTTAYNDITLNADGLSNISKTGVSKFGARHGWDIDNSFGGTWASNTWMNMQANYADSAGTTNDPKLAVTHSRAAGGGAFKGLLGVGA